MPEITFKISLELEIYIAGIVVLQYGVYENINGNWFSTAHVAQTGADGNYTVGILQ